MWDYRIIRCDLGWNIKKTKKGNGFTSVRFLGSNNKWILNKSYARIFYHEDTALSVLQIMKARDGNKSPN